MGAPLKIDTKHVPDQIWILLALIAAVFLVGTFGFILTDRLSITGAFTTTVYSLAFQSHGDLSPSGQNLNIFLAVIGVIIIWFSIWSAFGLALEGKFVEYFKEVKMNNKIASLKDHFIICGAGRVGHYVGKRLSQRGETVLFIEKDKEVVDKLVSDNKLVIDVGPIDEAVLLSAGVKHAKGIAIALGDDSKNLVILMTAKELNPHIRAAVRISDIKMLPRVRRAGAMLISMPEAIGGIKLADALLGERTDDIIS